MKASPIGHLGPEVAGAPSAHAFGCPPTGLVIDAAVWILLYVCAECSRHARTSNNGAYAGFLLASEVCLKRVFSHAQVPKVCLDW